MSIIVHISADVPDAMSASKTRAVQNLIAAAPDHRHIVYSLNRVSGWRGVEALPMDGDRHAVAYRAPDKGLFMASRMAELADWILADLDRQGVRPDVVHAHKLTVEGLAGEIVAERTGAALMISIRGDTDVKIIQVRRDLWPRLRRICGRAQALLSMSRWPLPQLRPALGDHVDRCHIVPSMTLADRIQAAPVVGRPHLITTFHLDVWRRKGADVLAKAAVIASRQAPGLVVDVIGGGSPASVMALSEMLRATGAEAHVRLLGPSPHDQVQARLAGYAGFVLPTRRETYGMAYVEALFAGLPVVYSKDRGIDGMTPPGATGPRVDPANPDEVAAGMLDLVRNEAAWKGRVAAAQAEGAFDGLRAKAIGAVYRGVLDDVLAASA